MNDRNTLVTAIKVEKNQTFKYHLISSIFFFLIKIRKILETIQSIDSILNIIIFVRCVFSRKEKKKKLVECFYTFNCNISSVDSFAYITQDE